MFKKIFVTQTDNFLIQLFRSTFVGGIATIADIALLYLLTEYFHIYYLVSAIASFTLGVTVNYFLSISWVFTNRGFKNKWAEFGAFTIIGITGLGLNIFFIWVFTEYAHIHYLISKVIATILVFAWNFLSRKYFIFQSPVEEPQELGDRQEA